MLNYTFINTTQFKMGMSKKCDVYPATTPTGIEAPCSNPNPANFEILRVERFGKNLVAEINYPDCTNYDGRKLCVYLNTSIDALITAPILDPHFSVAITSPFARFEPSVKGREAAVRTALFS